MGRQWNQIIESLGPLTGGTVSINANLGDIDALLTTLQADVADGITITDGTVTSNISDPYSVIQTAVENGLGEWSASYTGQMNVNANEIGGFPAATWLTDGGGNVPISGTVTDGTVTSIPTNSTSGGTGPTTFTSTTYGTIAVSNTNRKGLTIYNEGSGNLHVTLGTATTSTSSYTIRIIPTAYYEVPYNYTGLVGGIFATAGTARITEIT